METPPVKSKKKNLIGLWASLGIVGIIGLALVINYWPNIVRQFRAADSSVITDSEDKNRYKFSDKITSYEDVVAKVSPSVVSILTSTQTESLMGQDLSQISAGSGVILTKDGYILTNKHVVDGAQHIAIVTADDHGYYQAKTVALDPVNDLAYLKINPTSELSPIEVGNSKTIKVGQPVLAIGNALGEYQNSVTNGIISGVGRDLSATDQMNRKIENLVDLIQTDAAINPGNSGGALVNAAGQLIGINTAIAKEANGLGFAIPIGAAKGVIKQLGNVEAPQRAYLGVSYTNLTAATARRFNVKPGRGALVGENNGVVQGSPADKAGVKPGDVIIKIDQHEVGVVGGVATLVSEFAPGDQITLTIMRGNRTLTLKVRLGAFPES